MSKVRIGTRKSELALIQANMVKAELESHHSNIIVEIVEINTSGDWKPEHGETRLSEAQGGKGMFAKEIELAILEGYVDCGVHSIKDMSSFLPEGLVIEHVLPRENPLDALLTSDGVAKSIEDLPYGAVVGTSSLRRQAIALSIRPDLKIVPLRGNVSTRIEKLNNNVVDATFLAMAGLNRLGLEDRANSAISAEIMLPACAQGVIGIETRKDDERIRNIFTSINDFETNLCMVAERAVLQVLDGSCRTPIGAYAILSGDNMKMESLVASEDGKLVIVESGDAKISCVDEAEAFGQKIGRLLKLRTPNNILDKIENEEMGLKHIEC